MKADTCYIGLMSGTSMDGISAAATTFTNNTPQLIAARHQPYSPGLKKNLEDVIARPHQIDLQTLLALDHQIAIEFSDCTAALRDRLIHHDVGAIGSHGQTIYHLPGDSPSPNSWQLGDPSLIAERTGITTIADWRRRDMAAGGQGAPLAPVFHTHFLRAQHDIAVLNLGGIANITLIPATESTLHPTGFDTGPANTLMDSWIMEQKGEAYDFNGSWAASGKVCNELLSIMLRDPYFHKQPPKSTGREYFNLQWLKSMLAYLKEQPAPADIQATLAELTARSIALALSGQSSGLKLSRLYICGGGVHNLNLIHRLQMLLPDMTISSTESAGINPDYMEAIAFAWMASQTLQRKPIDTTSFTGARHPSVLGGIYYA